MSAEMGEYIRTLDEAIDAVAAILDLPSQRERLIQSTIRIMTCLHPEPREFMADSQALLIEGGLEALARKRREMMEALEEETAIVVLNPEEDGLFDAVGASLDALRLSDLAFRVFPALRYGCESWQAARALRNQELRFDEVVTQGIRRRGGDGYRLAQQNLERLIAAEKPSWVDRAAEIRDVCRSLFVSTPGLSETPVSDAEALFTVFAVDDERVAEMLAAIGQGPDAARDFAHRTFEAMTSLRSILRDKAA
jgi:hypothetical protein